MTRRTAYKLVAVVLLLLVAWKHNGIIRRVDNFRAKLERERLHEHKADISGLAPLRTDGSEWFSKYHFIAHNGGIIQGRVKSDSLEAWELSYLRGIRIIDADLNITSDGHLVLRHSWNDDLEQGSTPNQMGYDEFMGTKIFMKYTPMDIEGMIRFMMAHSDLYVAVDSKLDPSTIYPALLKAARDMDAEEILERIIVSLYRTQDINTVKGIYPFMHYVLRQYGFQHNWYELAEFCLKNDVAVVNVFDFVIEADPEGVKVLTDKGIHIYAAVVNSLKQLQKYKDMGITGAVSDYLSESDWELLQ